MESLGHDVEQMIQQSEKDICAANPVRALRVFICICVALLLRCIVRARARARACVCVCVCVCARARYIFEL